MGYGIEVGTGIWHDSRGRNTDAHRVRVRLICKKAMGREGIGMH